MKTDHSFASADPMNKLLAKLAEQQAVVQKQTEVLKSSAGNSTLNRNLERTPSLPLSPTMEAKGAIDATTARATSATLSEKVDTDEVARLKLQLEQANNKIHHLEAQTRLTDSGRATPIGGLEVDASAFGMPMHPSGPNTSNVGISRLPFPRDGGWPNVEETRSDANDSFPTTFSAGGVHRSKTIWNNTNNVHNTKPAYVNTFAQAGPVPTTSGPQPVPWGNARGSVPPFDDASTGYSSGAESHRNERLTPDPDMLGRSNSMRRGNRFENNHFGGHNGFGGGLGSYNMGYNQSSAYGGDKNSQSGHGGLGANTASNSFPAYGQQSMNSMSSPLSPHASEFSFPVRSDVSLLCLLTPFGPCTNRLFSGWLRYYYLHAFN